MDATNTDIGPFVVVCPDPFFVGNDSGPTHIAAAAGKKSFVIFGATSVAKNHPLSEKVKIISSGYNCQPCQGSSRWYSCNNWKCMNDLSSSKVIKTIMTDLEVRNLIRKKQLPLTNSDEPNRASSWTNSINNRWRADHT